MRLLLCRKLKPANRVEGITYAYERDGDELYGRLSLLEVFFFGN